MYSTVLIDLYILILVAPTLLTYLSHSVAAQTHSLHIAPADLTFPGTAHL